jgi:hypothetical protein
MARSPQPAIWKHIEALQLAGNYKMLTLAALICLALLTIALDLWLPAEVDLTILLALPLALVTIWWGLQAGLITGWTIAVLAEAANHLRWGDSVPWFVAPLNILIWGALVTVFVLVVTSAMQVQRLREEAVQLQTLQQTMVTVQDIVRNRLQLVTVVCDFLDEGVMPPARYSKRLRASTNEMMELLDELGQAENVTLYTLSDGVRGVAIEAGAGSRNL